MGSAYVCSNVAPRCTRAIIRFRWTAHIALAVVAFSRGGGLLRRFGLGEGRWFLLFGFITALWITIGITCGISDVYVDNLSGKAARLEVDGRPWMDAPDGTKARSQLRAGRHLIRTLATETGRELDRLEVTVDWTKPYALNVLGGMRYATGTIQYGDTPGREGRAYRTDKWFRLDYDFVFEWEADAIRVKKETKRTTRTYIRRFGRSSDPAPGAE